MPLGSVNVVADEDSVRVYNWGGELTHEILPDAYGRIVIPGVLSTDEHLYLRNLAFLRLVSTYNSSTASEKLDASRSVRPINANRLFLRDRSVGDRNGQRTGDIDWDNREMALPGRRNWEIGNV